MRDYFKDRAAKKRLGETGLAKENFLKQSEAEVATTKEYVDWLDQYLSGGGWVAVSPSNMDDNVLIARKYGVMPVLYGFQSLRIIAPRGVSISPPLDGSSSVYDMDFGIVRPLDIYPVIYADTIAELKHRGYSLKDLENQLDPSLSDSSYKSCKKALENAFAACPDVTPVVPASQKPVLDQEVRAAIKAVKAKKFAAQA
jgi:hypothetical protein